MCWCEINRGPAVYLDVLPGALLWVVVTPVIAWRKLGPLLNLVPGARKLCALHSPVPGDHFTWIVRSRHCHIPLSIDQVNECSAGL